MYKIIFNGCTISITEKEDQAIGLALNLHQVSNIQHTIIVQYDGEDVIFFKQYDLPAASQS